MPPPLDEEDVLNALKDTLFKKFVLGQDKEEEKKDDLFSKLLGGGRPPADFFKDPFGTKEWAKSKRVKKVKKLPVVSLELVDAPDEEVDKLREMGSFGYF